MTTIEEMFGTGADARRFALEAAKARDIARQYKVVAEGMAANPELMAAIRSIGAWLMAGPTDQLINDFALLRDPVEGAKVFGKRVGLDSVLAELTDPKTIQRTLEELTQTPQEEE